ncbi:MAG: TVP38/TMEM64 family protein, partial [Deltaproteobacteria bacterium]
IKIAWGLFFFVLILAIYFFTPAKNYFSRENFDVLKKIVEDQGAYAPLVFVGLYVAVAILCLPGTILTVLSGLIFGLWEGTLYVVIGANLGALATFLIARRVGRQTIERFLQSRSPQGWLRKLDRKIERGGFTVVLWLRLIPVIPYNLLNYTIGLTKVRLKDCLLGNLVGMLPGIFVYVSLGNAASQFSLTDPRVWTKIEVWGPFVLVILLWLIPSMVKRGRKDEPKI